MVEKVESIAELRQEISKLKDAVQGDVGTYEDELDKLLDEFEASVKKRIKKLEDNRPDEYFSQPLVNEINHRINELRRTLGETSNNGVKT